MKKKEVPRKELKTVEQSKDAYFREATTKFSMIGSIFSVDQKLLVVQRWTAA